MTYCFGWKYKNSVYLVADSLVTKTTPSVTSQSSIGEHHRQVRGEYIEEALLKLVPIHPGAAVVFSGDVSFASDIVKFLRENIYLSSSGTELLGWLTSSLALRSHDKQVEILIGITSENKPAELLYWNSENPASHGSVDQFQIGSLESYHQALTPIFSSLFSTGNLSEDRMLATISALIQSYGIHDNLVDQNVGGVIFGLRCFDGMIEWQDDTNIIVYSNDFSTFSFISVFARDDAIIVGSSITNDVRILMHTATTPSPEKWASKWLNYAKEKLASDKFRHWVFIRALDKHITIIRRTTPDSPGKLVKSTFADNGMVDFYIDQNLKNLLIQPLEDIGSNYLPIRINFKNDDQHN